MANTLFKSGASGSGGGASALEWVEGANAPLPAFENSNNVYLFTDGEGQDLYTSIKIPTSYVAGNQVIMKLPAYSSGNSGNALMQTVSTLIRNNTDAVTSTTNQRTSTNVAVSLPGTANTLIEFSMDLTSTTGQINSVSISAGDMIFVQLTRGTGTAVQDIAALVYGAEVTFT